MAMVLSDELSQFINQLVVNTKNYIVYSQGGVLGHAKFDPNSPITIKRKGHDIAMIWTGKMLKAITCTTTIENNTINIFVVSPVEYSSYAQLEDRNWDFLKITAEELNYYTQQIMNVLSIK